MLFFYSLLSNDYAYNNEEQQLNTIHKMIN